MKNNKGAIEIIVVVGILVVVGIVALFLMMRNSVPTEFDEATSADTEILSPSPVSDSTDISTLEMEVEATQVGDFEADIDSMVKDASEL